MKIITKKQAASFPERKRVPGTAGVYALIDPRDGRPRYVGSTQHAEHRLYAHMAETGRAKTPKQHWLAELKAGGLWPELWVLEEFEVGPAQSARRLEAERRWIEVCQELLAGADMNTTLTPVGHANSKDSNGKKLNAELVALRARVTELEHELAALCGFDECNMQHDMQRCTALHVAQLPKLQRNATLAYRQRCTLQ